MQGFRWQAPSYTELDEIACYPQFFILTTTRHMAGHSFAPQTRCLNLKLYLTNWPLDFTFSTKTSGHPVNLAFGKCQTQLSFSSEPITGAYPSSHPGLELGVFILDVCVRACVCVWPTSVWLDQICVVGSGSQQRLTAFRMRRGLEVCVLNMKSKGQSVKQKILPTPHTTD